MEMFNTILDEESKCIYPKILRESYTFANIEIINDSTGGEIYVNEEDIKGIINQAPRLKSLKIVKCKIPDFACFSDRLIQTKTTEGSTQINKIQELTFERSPTKESIVLRLNHKSRCSIGVVDTEFLSIKFYRANRCEIATGNIDNIDTGCKSALIIKDVRYLQLQGDLAEPQDEIYEHELRILMYLETIKTFLDQEKKCYLVFTEEVSYIKLSTYEDESILFKKYEAVQQLMSRLEPTINVEFHYDSESIEEKVVQKTILYLLQYRVSSFTLKYLATEKYFLDSINPSNMKYLEYLNECYISIPKEEHLTHFFRLWENCNNLEFVKVNVTCKGKIFPATRVSMKKFKNKKAGMIAILVSETRNIKNIMKDEDDISWGLANFGFNDFMGEHDLASQHF